MVVRPTGGLAPGRLRDHDREILRLAVPAFLALVAEPLFLLADSAIVGHLGTPELAALGIAAAVLGTLVSLCVFLAYGTTASVARQVGAGRAGDALAEGVAGLWLAVLIGVVVTVLTWPFAAQLCGLFDPSPRVADLAVTYLRIALPGVTAMLLVLAATGVLRGLQDTRTPLVVAVVANLANIALNLVLVYGAGAFAGLGIAGSALGTLIAQVGSAAALVWFVVRGARRAGASVRPHVGGVVRAARAGIPLIVRTLLLRCSLLVMTYAAARLGEDELATMQLALSIWTFLAFVLDAVAIAAQAITGRYLGAEDAIGARAVTRRIEWWGWATGLRHRRAARGGLARAGLAVHRRRPGPRPARARAARRGVRPARRRHRLRPRRRADRRRGRRLPRVGAARLARAVRPGGVPPAPGRFGLRRRLRPGLALDRLRQACSWACAR